MIKGLYSAFTAMDAAWKYQDVLANNIANSNTIGYKREVGSMQAFPDVLLSQQSAVPAPIAARIQAIVGQIGTGKFVAEFSTDFEEGDFQQTGEDLDMAVGVGFFAVEGPDGLPFYTRAGRFQRDANDDLVTTAGYRVLGADGAAINFGQQHGKIKIDSDGTIELNEQQVGRLRIVDFTPADLRRAGEAYFLATSAGQQIEGGVRQGVIERSNTEMTEEMTSMVAVQRTYQANQSVLSQLDQSLELATAQLGRWR